MISKLTMIRRQQRRNCHQSVVLSPILLLSVSSLCLGILSILFVTTVVAEEEDWIVGVDGEVVSEEGEDAIQGSHADGGQDGQNSFTITENEMFELMEIADQYGEKQALEYPYESDDEEENREDLDWQLVKSRNLEMDRYMKERQESATESLSDCRNLHEYCIAWATFGECGGNSEFMIENCAPSCRACDGYLEELPAHDLAILYGVAQLGLTENFVYDDVATTETLESSVREMHEYMKEIDQTVPCRNKNEYCLLWALQGECENSVVYMNEECAPSCYTCGTTEQHRLEEEQDDEVDDEVDDELYGVPQTLIEHGLEAETAQTLLDKLNNYMKDVVFGDESFASARETCRNQDENCLYWAHLGECENNPSYMHSECAPACEGCEQKGNYESRCGRYAARNSEDIWQPGDLDRMFERITTDQWFVEQYNPTILGGPGITAEIDGMEDQPTPWIVTLDNFLTEEECDALIELGAKQIYERSLDSAEELPDGSLGSKQSDQRTSENAWCTSPCFDDPVAKRVLQKIEFTTGVPDTNSEYLQMLRYEPGQFYEPHHDYIIYSSERLMGPRIVTVFLYLNDVEAGGGTRFTDLDLTVMPKRGRALLWPSVLSDQPNMKDHRTHHEALPVEKGVKFGANAWLHLRDFKFPYSVNCI